MIWSVPGVVLRVVDADTVRIRLDLGWSIYSEQSCRIIGVNAPELRTPAGRAAMAWAVAELPAGLPVTFVSRQLDKYGRPLGQILYGPTKADYGAALLAAGHAVVYLV